MSRLNWNKNNIDIATSRIEEMMLNDKDNREVYGIIRAILWAIGFILDEMHKGEKK